MRISDFVLLDSTTDIIVDTTTGSFQLEHLIGYSLSISFTASSSFTGNFVLQASNDDVTWIDLASSATSGTSGDCMFNVTDVFYKHARFKIDMTTGTINTIKVITYTKGW